ncbi:MAG: polysaccharide biosynthesis tyrosine autokinase [Acidimicrobiales bacterium]
MLSQEAADELELRDYLQVLSRRKGVIALSFLVVVGIAVVASYLQTPRYAANAKLLLRPRGAATVFGQPSAQSNANSERALQTEIEVLEAEPVRDLVREKLGSAPSVQVGPVGQTDLITIRAESTDARRAAMVANAYANAYIEFRRKQAVDEFAAASEELQTKITDLNRQLENLGAQLAAAPACTNPATTPEACSQRANVEQTVNARRTTLLSQLGLFQQRLDQLQVDSGLASGNVQLVTPASAPSEPFAPTPVRNAVLGAVLGLMLGVGLAFLREYLDDSVKDKEDLERAVPGLGVLGLIPAIPDWKSKEQARVISLSDPTSQAAEAYRILRTSIQFVGIDRDLRLIQVTSASAQEGKTTTLSNLAVAFASSGLRTVAVCCDLRRPRLNAFFGLDNAVGYTSVLLGSVALSKALQPVPGQERLLVLASGPLPPNPAELLSSSRNADLLRNLAAQADVVLIDSPPVLPVTDSLVLSQRVDATVLVTSAGTTTRKAAHRAAEMLHQVNAPLVGAVLNGVSEEIGYGGYSSRYYGVDKLSGPTTGSNGNGAAGQPAGRWRRRVKRST